MDTVEKTKEELRREYRRQHYLDHKDKYKANAAANYAAKKDEYAERSRRYRENNVARIMFLAARDRCRKLELPFDLTIEYIESIMPTHCPVFGMKLEVGKGKPRPDSPSLDRIRPELGYVQGNVQVLSNKANMMKQDATADELRQFAEWVLATG